jgi:hypothetical protein
MPVQEAGDRQRVILNSAAKLHPAQRVVGKPMRKQLPIAKAMPKINAVAVTDDWESF